MQSDENCAFTFIMVEISLSLSQASPPVHSQNLIHFHLLNYVLSLLQLLPTLLKIIPVVLQYHSSFKNPLTTLCSPSATAPFLCSPHSKMLWELFNTFSLLSYHLPFSPQPSPSGLSSPALPRNGVYQVYISGVSVYHSLRNISNFINFFLRFHHTTLIGFFLPTKTATRFRFLFCFAHQNSNCWSIPRTLPLAVSFLLKLSP